jgi:hypothetical protein
LQKYVIIYTERRGDMDNKNKKPTAYEIVELIIKALAAMGALITAFRWW